MGEKEGEREEDGDVGEEEEEERIRVCKEGKSCDALPHYLLAARPASPFFGLFAANLYMKDISKKPATCLPSSILFPGVKIRSILL